MKTDNAHRANSLSDNPATAQRSEPAAKTSPQAPTNANSIGEQVAKAPDSQKPGKLLALTEYDTYGKYARRNRPADPVRRQPLQQFKAGDAIGAVKAAG